MIIMNATVPSFFRMPSWLPQERLYVIISIDSLGFYRLHVLGLPCFRLAVFVYIVSEISRDSPTSATQGKSSGSPVFSLLLDQQYFSRRLSPTLSSVQQRGLLDYLLYSYSYILTIKPTRCTDFSNLFFGIKLYMFWTVPLPIIRSFSLYTQKWYMSYISCSQAVSKPV